MPTTDEDRVLESLDEAECRRLLTTTAIGRLGFTEDALPAIVPVSFTLRDGHVLIPARQGSSVVNAVRGSVVAFEVDSYDAAAGTGWSVTVVGPTRLVSVPDDVADLGELRFSARPSATERCSIAVQLGLLRGWRMSHVPTASAGPLDGAGTSPGR